MVAGGECGLEILKSMLDRYNENNYKEPQVLEAAESLSACQNVVHCLDAVNKIIYTSTWPWFWSFILVNDNKHTTEILVMLFVL